MRTFVILLVVTNLVYFGWAQGWLRDMPERVGPVQADGLPAFVEAEQGLTLLSEMPGAEQNPEQDAEGQPALAETGAQPPLEPLVGTDAESAAGSEDLPDPVLADTPDILPGPRWCAELGLFTAAAPAETLVPELLLLGIDADLATGRRPVGTTFWVHSLPFASEEAALSLLAELQEKNIDSFYMRDGELAGRISLGVFSREESAQSVQTSLEGQGYEAEISQVARAVERFWLELQAPSVAVLENPDWRALAGRLGLVEGAAEGASADAPRLTEKVCIPVASPTQFP